MALKLKGSTSGFVGLDAPAVSGNNTLILPENSGSAFQLFANDITAGVTTFTQVTVSRNGDLTVPGTISIGGTLTYEDVTSVDSVGIVTARGLSIFGNTTGLQVASGISTFSDVSARNITGVAVTFTGALSGTTASFNSGTTNTVATFTSSDSGAVINITDNSARSSIEQNGTDLKIISDTDASDADSTIKFQVDASTKAIINSSGYFGLGTNTPQRLLHLQSTGDALARITSADGNAAYLELGDVSDPDGGKIVYDTGSNLTLYTASSERLRIDSSGRLLIGTTTEGYADADNLTIRDSGNCGITIRSGTSNYGSVFFSDATSGSGEYDGFVQYDHINQKITFGAGASGAPKLSINSSSNAQFTGIVTATQFAATTINNSRKNLLINGEMKVNQRVGSPGLSYFNPVTSAIYTLDRWKVMNGSSFDTDSAHISKSTQSPAGFGASMKWDIGNTETPSANQNCGIEQKIEGQNLQGLAYGTSSAKTMTLSFYVYSNKLGTYCVHIMQEDGTKYQMHEYTISSSNTWEKKTIKIVGNTANAINDDNTTGLRFIWVLTVGSGDTVAATSTWASGGDLAGTSNQVNLWDNGSNYWYLTGCQLELGDVATAYEHPSIGEELALCERYYEKSYDLATRPGTNTTAGSVMFLANRDPGTAHTMLRFATRKRAQPTVTAYDPTQANTTGMANVDDGTNLSYSMNRMGEMGCTAYPTGSINLGKFIQFHYIAESEL